MLMMYPMPSLNEMLSASSLNRARLCRAAAARHNLSTNARTPQVHEKENEYTITVSAPGVRKQDLSITAIVDEHAVLKMHGETKTSTHTHFLNWTTHLPRGADADKATATHVDGLLQVTIPKKAAAKTVVALLADGETTPGESSHYTMRLNCAGIAKSDLGLTIEDDLLTVTGETKSRGAWMCPQKYRLPSDADGTKACASYVDGILTIAVEKKSIAEPKRIEVTVMSEVEKNKDADEDDDGDAEKTDKAAAAMEDDEGVMV